MFDGGPSGTVPDWILWPRYGTGFGGIMGPLEIVGIGDGTLILRVTEEAGTAIFTTGALLVDWGGRLLLVVGAGGMGLKEPSELRIDVCVWA